MKNKNIKKIDNKSKIEELPISEAKDEVVAENSFMPQEEHIQMLEMSVDILQSELREAVNRLSEILEEKTDNSPIKEETDKTYTKTTSVDLPIFSDFDTTKEIFDNLYQFLKTTCEIMELDYFDTTDSENIKKIQGIGTSVNLEKIYQDLEERGLLEWIANNGNVKMLPSLDNSIDHIKSLIIIPISILKNTVGFFIANTPILSEKIDAECLNQILVVAQNAYLQMDIIRNSAEKKNANIEYNILLNQMFAASNQIAASELLLILNEGFEMPFKVMKTNIDLLQKGVGDAKRRVDILIEQFANLSAAHKLMDHFGTLSDVGCSYHKFSYIFEQILVIVVPKLGKNGVTLETNYYENMELKELMLNCYEIQLVFALSEIILHPLLDMPEGGKMSIGIFKNDTNRLSIIVSDNGLGTEELYTAGNLIPLLDLSEKKIKNRFLFYLSQNIISQHNGKFSLFTNENKGTTYKISLPLLK